MIQYILGSIRRNHCIISSPYQDDMNQTHTNKQGYNAPKDDPVLAEKLIVANQSTKDSKEDNH